MWFIWIIYRASGHEYVWAIKTKKIYIFKKKLSIDIELNWYPMFYRVSADKKYQWL